MTRPMMTLGRTVCQRCGVHGVLVTDRAMLCGLCGATWRIDNDEPAESLRQWAGVTQLDSEDNVPVERSASILCPPTAPEALT